MDLRNGMKRLSAFVAVILSLGAAQAAEAPVVAGGVAVSAAQRYVAIDVTPQVKSWLASTANHGLALVATGGEVRFDAKENIETSHD